MSEAKEIPKHQAPKPCQFCGLDANYTPLDKMERHSVGVHFCYNCNAEFLYYKSGAKASFSLYTKINNKLYRWTVAGQSGTIWYVDKPGVPGVSVNEGMTAVKTFYDDVPDITPQNINDKLKTWLLFL